MSSREMTVYLGHGVRMLVAGAGDIHVTVRLTRFWKLIGGPYLVERMELERFATCLEEGQTAILNDKNGNEIGRIETTEE